MTPERLTCHCGNCDTVPHDSDCAIHDGPAYPTGPCNCGEPDVQ